MHTLGASVTAIDAETALQLRLPPDVRGVLVTGVEDGSSAASHLATPDEGGPDIILSVEGTPVQTPEQLRAALNNAKTGSVVTLRVYNVPAKTKRIERVKLGGDKGSSSQSRYEMMTPWRECSPRRSSFTTLTQSASR